MLKKLTLSFLSSLIILFSIAPYTSVMAATPTPAPTLAPTWYNSDFGTWYGKVYDPNNPSEIFGERYTAAQVQWIIYGLFSFLINSATGPENSSIIQCFLNSTTNITKCADDLKDKLKFVEADAKDKLAVQKEEKSLWQLVFATDRPISAISYTKEKLENFSIIPTAHAQTAGFGFDVLKPIQNLWTTIRNVSYGFFVLAAIVMAFMIMFRVKISPQVVITVQSAIPKMVTALILVTFSYAIAGLLIDLMYVVFGLIALSFSSMGGLLGSDPPKVFMMMTQGQATGDNVNFGILLMGAVYVVAFIIGFILLLFYNIGVLGTALLVSAVGLLNVALGSILSLLGVLLVIILVIIIIWNFIKTVWGLFKAFANVILLTIFAPLQIAAGVIIPSMGFGAWIKSFVSNLAVFVVTSTLFLFAFVFLAQGWNIGFSEFIPGLLSGNTILQILLGSGVASGFIPDISSAAWPPLLGGGDAVSGVGLLLMGVSFVLFTMIPKATELVQSLMSGKPFAYGTAISEPFAAAWGVSGGPVLEGFKRSYGQDFANDRLKTLTTAINKLVDNFTGTKRSG